VKNPNTIYLIDGNSLAYRAFYALPDTMRNSAGITTNAIYGFTTMLLKILDNKPDFVAISFDLPEPTFRHKEYKEYKGTRDKAPPTLYEQFPYVKDIARAFDIPIYEKAGFEADDVIGTLAKTAEKEGLNVVILSGDKDPLQLVDEKIKVLYTRKGISDTVLYGETEVKEHFGLTPKQLIDYKALKGDSSDNIPGVPKVGDKTATDLLKEYGDLDNIYKNIDKITKKSVKETLKNNVELANLSKKLGTIVTDVPINVDFDKCKRKGIDWKKVIPLFEQFEFDRLIKKYGQELDEHQTEAAMEKKREEISKLNFKCVKNEKDLANLIDEINRAEVFAFDLETTSLDVFEAKIVGISFSTEKKSAYYVPLGHKDTPPIDINKLKPLFTLDKLKIGHNIKYDIEVLNCNGIEVAGPLFDTMVAAYLLDPTSGKYSLKKLGKQFLGRDMIKLVELIGKDAEYENFSEVPIDIATDYACSDADVTFSLYDIFKLALKVQKLEKLFYNVEMPVVESIIEMELNGIAIDQKLLKKLSEEIEVKLKDLEKHIFCIAGETFNINSPKQLANILFNKLQLPVIKRTKTGPSTNVEVLEELASKKIEIAEKLMEYRTLTKLKSTYIDVFPTIINSKTGRIHTSFNQTVTATGRLSSSKPNLQNIPARGEWGKLIRSAFIPEKKDWVFLAADYSQVELRILAHLSKDKVLINAFNNNEDIHSLTAAQVYDVPESKVTSDMRSSAKTINFGIIYGMSEFGLAKQLKIKKNEAVQFIDKYFAKYKGVKEFIEKTIKQAKEDTFVTTMLGRKRGIPDINNPNYGLRSFAERTATNTPVQGTAADMIKVAMANLKSKLKDYKSKLILQVHDELIFECPKSEVEKVKKIVEEEMANAIKLDVPVKVDVGIGKNWAEAK
jgi:DNA polymerase I